MKSPFDARPIIVALAGPNGAGKSTFFRAHLATAGLRFVNDDELAGTLRLPAMEAAEIARGIRDVLVEHGESFVFETVLSDPTGDKVAWLARAAARGNTVVLCFIGLDKVARSKERVEMRVLQGGHDVPNEKLAERFPRTLLNLGRAIRALPHVLVFDNSDLKLAEFERGAQILMVKPTPAWLRRALRTR